MALDLGPTEGQLLEADLIEWNAIRETLNGLQTDSSVSTTPTTLATAGNSDTEAFQDEFMSLGIDLPEGTDVWGTLIDSARSGGLPVELGRQLVAVYDAAIADRGGLPIRYPSSVNDPGVYEGATFLLTIGGSDLFGERPVDRVGRQNRGEPAGIPGGLPSGTAGKRQHPHQHRNSSRRLRDHQHRVSQENGILRTHKD